MVTARSRYLHTFPHNSLRSWKKKKCQWLTKNNNFIITIITTVKTTEPSWTIVEKSFRKGNNFHIRMIQSIPCSIKMWQKINLFHSGTQKASWPFQFLIRGKLEENATFAVKMMRVCPFINWKIVSIPFILLAFINSFNFRFICF